MGRPVKERPKSQREPSVLESTVRDNPNDRQTNQHPDHHDPRHIAALTRRHDLDSCVLGQVIDESLKARDVFFHASKRPVAQMA